MEARDKRAAEQGKGKIMRNSFVLYTEYAKQISLLTMEQRGQLLTAIIQYVTDDTVPELDAVTEMAFSIIQIRLDRDEEAYQASLERKRRAGAMGGRARAENMKRDVADNSAGKQSIAEDSTARNDAAENSTDKQRLGNLHVPVPDPVPVPEKHKKIFSPPTADEVTQYCQENGYWNVNADQFVDFYACKGWMVGKSKMKDWKAAVRNWNRSQRQGMTANGKKSGIDWSSV